MKFLFSIYKEISPISFVMTMIHLWWPVITNENELISLKNNFICDDKQTYKQTNKQTKQQTEKIS